MFSRVFRSRHPIRLSTRNDLGVAGVVAGIIMLGSIIAFLAYMNVAWVPAWTENKEANHAEDISAAMSMWATNAEDHVSRAQTSKIWTVQIPLGVSGLPILGAGASSGELSVSSMPTLNVSMGSLPMLTANGGVAMSTHTQRYPNQTYQYALGGLEKTQYDGAWVDLRGMLSVARTNSGAVSLVIQAINLTGAPQQVGGNGHATIAGSVASVSDQTHSAGNVTLQIQDVHAGAWRAALNRTLITSGLHGESAFRADCQSFTSTKNYCFTSANNTATNVEIMIYNVASGWMGQVASVSAELRS